MRISHSTPRCHEAQWPHEPTEARPLRRYRRSPVSLLSALILIGQITTPTLAQPAAPQADAPDATTALATGQVRITQVASGLSSPIGVTNAGDGTNRLFVVEQRGTVRVFSGNSLQSGFFLDIRGVAGGFDIDITAIPLGQLVYLVDDIDLAGV